LFKVYIVLDKFIKIEAYLMTGKALEYYTVAW